MIFELKGVRLVSLRSSGKGVIQREYDIIINMCERRPRKQERPEVIAIQKKLIELGVRYSQEIAPERIDRILNLCRKSNEALEIISYLLDLLDDNLRASESFQLLCDLLSCQMDDLEIGLEKLEEQNLDLLSRLKKLKEDKANHNSRTNRLLFFSDRVINGGTDSLPLFDKEDIAKIDAWLERYSARDLLKH